MTTKAELSTSTNSLAIPAYLAPTTVAQNTVGLDCLGCGINAATGIYLQAYKEQLFDMASLSEVAQIITRITRNACLLCKAPLMPILVNQTPTQLLPSR